MPDAAWRQRKRCAPKGWTCNRSSSMSCRMQVWLRAAVVASTGASMYMTKDTIVATLCRVATLAPGSTLAMSSMLPIELRNPRGTSRDRACDGGARANGTPFVRFFTPSAILTLARDDGFREVQRLSAATLAQRYFAGRTDGLRPPDNAEELLRNGAEAFRIFALAHNVRRWPTREWQGVGQMVFVRAWSDAGRRALKEGVHREVGRVSERT